MFMPIIRIISETNKYSELGIHDIDKDLNDILTDSHYFSSPNNKPNIEQPHNEHTGYLPAGSIVAVTSNQSNAYHSYSKGERAEFTTHTFQFNWDKNINKHDEAEHWNIKIFKTIHLLNSKSYKTEYKLPKINNIDHIKNSNWIQLELLDDSRNIISSKKFERANKSNCI